MPEICGSDFEKKRRKYCRILPGGRINALAADYPETDNAPVNFALIARTAEAAAAKSIAYYGTVISGADRPAAPGADSFNAAEAALFKEIIGKRNRQIQNAQVHLNILEHTQDIR